MAIEESTSRFFSSGEGDMSVLFSPVEGGSAFKLVYVRVHFRLLSGANANSNLQISLDSFEGEEYDVDLYAANDRGVGSDMNMVIPADERSDPSPWHFRAGDALLLKWPAALGIAWGVEVGYQI